MSFQMFFQITFLRGLYYDYEDNTHTTVCRMDESWVNRPETLVTNDKEAARMIKLVRPRWKRSDLILQVLLGWPLSVPFLFPTSVKLTRLVLGGVVSLWKLCCLSLSALFTCSVFLHFVQTTAGWLIISTTRRRSCLFRPCLGFIWKIFITIIIVCFLTSKDSVEKVSQVLVRFPDPPYGVGRENEPPRSWEFYFGAR